MGKLEGTRVRTRPGDDPGDFGGTCTLPADPLGADDWNLLADPRATLIDPPAVDPALVDPLETDESDDDAMWEASLPPAAVMARARAERADDLVAELVAIDGRQARLEARKAIVLAALTTALGGSSEDPVQRLNAPHIAASELAAALRISQRTADGTVAEALRLTDRVWEPVLTAMASGALPHRRAVAVLDAAAPIPREHLAEFAAEAVRVACPPDPGRTPNQGVLKRRMRRLSEKYVSEPLTVRKQRARAHRRVDLEPAQDGMCWLSAFLPLEVGAAIDTRLEAIARSLEAPTEQRTINQLRADVLADLLVDHAPGPVPPTKGPVLPTKGPVLPTKGPTQPAKGVVLPARSAESRPGETGAISEPRGGVRTELVVTVPARTLTGDSDSPGEIVGYGAIDADAARLLASQAATWTRLFVDPDSGAPLAIGRRRYTPTLAMRRFLGARDRTCRFPGCDKPAAATQADHTREWAEGGTTEPGNLALLCPQHHRLKTLGHWRVRHILSDALSSSPEQSAGTLQQPPGGPRQPTGRPEQPPGGPGRPLDVPAWASGTLEWTAPSGRTYVTYPEGETPPPF